VSLWPQELTWDMSVRQLAVLAKTPEGQVCIGANVPAVRKEAGRFLWVVQQSKVIGCCPGVQALRMFRVIPVDMLAVEVTNIQIGMWERRDGRWCESQAWRFVDVNYLVSCNVYAQPLSLWLFWRLINQWPFQPLMDKRGKAVVPAQHWPSYWEVGNHSLICSCAVGLLQDDDVSFVLIG